VRAGLARAGSTGLKGPRSILVVSEDRSGVRRQDMLECAHPGRQVWLTFQTGWFPGEGDRAQRWSEVAHVLLNAEYEGPGALHSQRSTTMGCGSV